MPNPSPRQTEEFKKHWFKPVGEMPPEKLCRTPVAVTVGESIYNAISGLERADRITWLRRVITEAASRELGASPAVNPGADPPVSPGGEVPLGISHDELLEIVDGLLAGHRYDLPKPARDVLTALRTRLEAKQ